MLYSEIVESYYRVNLTNADKELVDSFFTGCAHHYLRHIESLQRNNVRAAEFHFELFRRHLCHLKCVIYLNGKFLEEPIVPDDPFLLRENWIPHSLELPDTDMFSFMHPLSEANVGMSHPNDNLLKKFFLDIPSTYTH